NRGDPRLRDRAHVRGLRTLFALGDLVLDSLSLAQGTLACPLDTGGVDEDVLAPIIWGDESVALPVVEPLDDPDRHAALLGLGPYVDLGQCKRVVARALSPPRN